LLVTSNDGRFTLMLTGRLRTRRGMGYKGGCTAQGRAFAQVREVAYVSIVRVGLAETKNFAEGYDAIFSTKKKKSSTKTKAVAKSSTAKKKKKPSKKK